MSNYPPGVSGNEYEIAGPDREFTDERDCSNCDRTAVVDVTGYGWEEWWTCPYCAGYMQVEIEPEDPPNYWED